METKELYYPQISAQAGSYTFEEGVELEIYSSKSSYYDWAKIRFTSQFRPKLSLKKKDPATIQLGYDGTLEDVFTGFVSGNYDGGTYANEVALKDEMLLMEETIINDTFLDTTPQELISYFLAQAGLSKMSSPARPTRRAKCSPFGGRPPPSDQHRQCGVGASCSVLLLGRRLLLGREAGNKKEGLHLRARREHPKPAPRGRRVGAGDGLRAIHQSTPTK
mgnify:CR=1 FL=1